METEEKVEKNFRKNLKKFKKTSVRLLKKFRQTREGAMNFFGVLYRFIIKNQS